MCFINAYIFVKVFLLLKRKYCGFMTPDFINPFVKHEKYVFFFFQQPRTFVNIK